MRALGLALGVFLALTGQSALAQSVGDVWVGRRGDLTTGATFSAVTTTRTGRILAVGDSGQMMVSDDGGTNWTFRRMETQFGPVTGSLRDLQEFTVLGGSQKRIVGLYTFIVETQQAGFDGEAKTFVVRSDDDGATWTQSDFPDQSQIFQGHEYRGIDLYGLHVSPTGHLVAFGTISVADLPFVWSFGGLIYRSGDGVNWDFARFAYGPLREMADAGGRLVAVGSQTVIDSGDAAGWNGYLLSQGQILTPSGPPLDAATVDRLRLEDVAWRNGAYVAHAVTYVPYNGIVGIDSARVDRRFTLVAGDPFGASSLWTAYDQTAHRGKLFPTAAALLGFTNGVFKSPDDGQSWTSLDATVVAPTETVVRTGAQTISVVGSANAAWKATNDGASFTKTWNPPTGPDLGPAGVVGDRIFAVAEDDDLWASDDDGLNWRVLSPEVSFITFSEMTRIQIVASGDRLVMGQNSGKTVRTSEDGGATWTDRAVGDDNYLSAESVGPLVTPTGRLVLPVQGRVAFPSKSGVFFVSDDGGLTWTSRKVGHDYQEAPSAGIVTRTGRILVFMNPDFIHPTIFRSDDNGETWTRDEQLQFKTGLDPVTSTRPGETTITVARVQQGASGRLVLLGDDDELLTSDDDGTTWTVRVNMDQQLGQSPRHAIYDVQWAGDRWVGFGSRETATDKRVHFALTSDDDGTTWSDRPLPLRQNNTELEHRGLRTTTGRILAFGTNGAVYSTDGPPDPAPDSTTASVREGESLAIQIPRPPVPGAITARYSGVEGTALAGQDYVAFGGDLSWTDTDLAPKTVTLQTVDNAAVEADERLTVQVVFETAALRGESTIPLTITDDDGSGVASLRLDVDPSVRTTEAGGQTTIYASLTKQPTGDVTVTITGLDATEGSLSATNFVFTSTNWNRRQSLVVTGVDDAESDLDVAYRLTFDVSSADTAYNALFNTFVSVVNADDEPPPTGGGGGDAFLLASKAQLKLNAKTPARSTFTASGTLDAGAGAPAFVGAATLTVGGFSSSVTLSAKGKRVGFKSAAIDLQITPGKPGSSRAAFTLKLTGDLASDIAADGLLTIRFESATIDAAGQVRLAAGKYTQGKDPSALVAPAIAPLTVSAKAPGGGKDSLTLVVSFPVAGAPPATAPDLTVAFGGFSRTIAAADFKGRAGGPFTAKKPASAPGVASAVIDYRKGTITLRASKVDLGAFGAGPGVAVTIVVTLGGDTRTARIVASRKGTAISY